MDEAAARSELLVVADAFQIMKRGLVVVPDFSVPDGGWPRSLAATIVRPDGRRLDARLFLQLAHFRFRDPSSVPPDRRWRVVPCFPDLTKDDVPPGSRVLVDAAAARSFAARAG